MAAKAGTRILPLNDAPTLVPGVTATKDGETVREVVLKGYDSAAVYLVGHFEISEIRYHYTEPTKKKPDGKGEWRTTQRIGAPRLGTVKVGRVKSAAATELQ